MRAIWFVVLCACGMTRGESLSETIRVYNDNMRWERFPVAAIHVPAAQRSQFVDEADARAKDVKITDYEIVRVDRKGHAAKVHVKLSWYRESEGMLHETQAMQTWEQHGKAWMIVDETRLRGTEMPGLPEALK